MLFVAIPKSFPRTLLSQLVLAHLLLVCALLLLFVLVLLLLLISVFLPLRVDGRSDPNYPEQYACGNKPHLFHLRFPSSFLPADPV
jgi:hypothetical protein